MRCELEESFDSYQSKRSRLFFAGLVIENLAY